MKTYIIILVILSLASCRPQRNAVQQVAQHNQEQYQQRQSYIWGDSLYRRWYFYSDSPFVYHPDSSLIANSGYLWVGEDRLQSMLHQLDRDSSLDTSSTYLSKQRERKERSSVYLGIGLAVLIVLVYVYKKGSLRIK